MKDLQFHLYPQTFKLTVQSKGKSFTFYGCAKESIADLKEEKNAVSWTYPHKGISITVKNK
ncbi:hypothetical protein ACSFCG_13070, partial [Enterococcus faecalis]